MFAKLSVTQAAMIRMARQHSDDVERKAVKKEIFGVVRARFGIIPASLPLMAEVQPDSQDYLLVKVGSKSPHAGKSFLLDADDQWIGNFGDAVAAPVADTRIWVKTDIESLVESFVKDSYFESDAEVELDPAAGMAPGRDDFAMIGDTVYIKLQPDA